MKFKKFLTERRYAEYDGFPIFLNPTPEELIMCGANVRCFFDMQGNLFVWNSEVGFHEEIIEYLGEQDSLKFSFYRDGGDYYPQYYGVNLSGMSLNVKRMILGNPNVKKALAGNLDIYGPNPNPYAMF